MLSTFSKTIVTSFLVNVSFPGADLAFLISGGPNAKNFLSGLRKRYIKNISYKILIKRVLNK